MMKGTRTKVLAALALAGALGLTGSPAMAAGSGAATAYTCTGGDVPSGTYSRITVTGMCSVAAGAVIVDDSRAPVTTVLADPDGNKACVGTFQPTPEPG